MKWNSLGKDWSACGLRIWETYFLLLTLSYLKLTARKRNSDAEATKLMFSTKDLVKKKKGKCEKSLSWRTWLMNWKILEKY